MADRESDSSGEAIEEINAEEAGNKAGNGAQAGDGPQNEIASQLMKNPRVLAALQSQLDSIVGTSSGYIENLPKVVKRRIKALKKLQFEMVKTEAKFYQEVHELECKYAARYAPLCDKRKEIVSGAIEPTDSDCDWPSDEEDEGDEVEKVADAIKNKATVKEIDETKDGKEKDEAKEVEPDESTKGIPSFWLTTFQNVNMISDMIQEHDEPILHHLVDVKVKLLNSEADSMGFKLEFYFTPNDFFTNTVLTKEYFMKGEPDENDPFGFEGPEIVKCKGCVIDWKKGKNVTVKVIKKTQKHKGRGTKRTVTKTVTNDSFFNFFAPPDVPDNEEPEEEDDEDGVEALLAADFEIGHFIRERVVPRAVLYFTGEAIMDEEFDEEEGDEEEGGEEEYDEDADGDYVPGQGEKGAAQAPECKQQ